MDENHQDKTESKLIAMEGVRWEVNRQSKLWVPKHKRRTGFEEKTRWDRLNLFGTLAIPIVVALATIAFGFIQFNLASQQHELDQKIAFQQHQADQLSALDQQQASILQTYIDNIQDLLLNHNLLKSRPTYDVAIIATARTLTALQGLDPIRRGVLLNFIYEAQLIGFEDINNNNLHGPIIDLTNAALIYAYLKSANLNGANLANAYLNGAKINGADLINVDLEGADLNNTKLNGANFTNANLTNVDLEGADLINAMNLTQQQLDQVSSCKGAILPTGLTCHNNQPQG